jgi:hypothetical protein
MAKITKKKVTKEMTALEATGSKTHGELPVFKKTNLYATKENAIVTVADGAKSSRVLELMDNLARTLDDPIEEQRTIIIGNKEPKAYAWRAAMTVLEHGSAHVKVMQIRNFDKLMEIQRKVLGILTFARMRVNSYKNVQVRTLITTVSRTYKSGIQIEYHLVFLAQELNPLGSTEKAEETAPKATKKKGTPKKKK